MTVSIDVLGSFLSQRQSYQHWLFSVVGACGHLTWFAGGTEALRWGALEGQETATDGAWGEGHQHPSWCCPPAQVLPTLCPALVLCTQAEPEPRCAPAEITVLPWARPVFTPCCLESEAALVLWQEGN